MRGAVIIVVTALAAGCNENPTRRDGAPGPPDRYVFDFPKLADQLAPDAAPAGDDRCSGAKPVTFSSGKATLSGSTATALNEFGDQVRCGEQSGFVGPQHYYSLTMDSAKVYRFTLTPQFDAVLYLFSECSKTLINVDCASGGATGALSPPIAKGQSGGVTFVPPASGIYRFAVDSADAAEAGAYQLVVEELSAPDHGACASPKKLTLVSGSATVTDSTLGALNENGTQLTCGLTATLDGPQLYYEVDLTGGEWYRLTLEPQFTATLYVAGSAGGCNATNIETDCSGITGTVLPLVPKGGKAATAFRPLTSGSYLVVVDSPDPKQAGAFTLTLESKAPEAGATCQGATQLPLVGGEASVSGDTTPLVNDLGALVSCGASAPLVGHQAYYSVDLKAGVSYQVLLKPDFPAVLGVGQACATFPIDCASGGATGDAVAVPAKGFGSRLFTPKTSGAHVIGVDSTSLSALGTFTLQIAEYQSPTNGTCAAPKLLTLTQSPVEAIGDTGPLKNDLSGVDCGDPKGPWPGPQAYYQVALKAGVQYTVTLLPDPTFDAALYAFPAATTCGTTEINSGCQGFSSDAVGAGTQESVVLQPAVDTDYVLVVDSWSPSEVGSYALQVAWP